MHKLVLLKYVEQLWSQSWTMERSNPEARVGKVWDSRALVGRSGTLISPSCVDFMIYNIVVIGL